MVKYYYMSLMDHGRKEEETNTMKETSNKKRSLIRELN